MNVIKAASQIECMIALLQNVKEELEFAENISKMENKEEEKFEYKRFPSGTFMRENLKTVSMIAKKTADQIVLSPYCREIEKDNNEY